MIILGIATAAWYGYNFIYDLYFAGKGSVSAVTIDEKEVDIKDELEGFQQFGVDGYVKTGDVTGDTESQDTVQGNSTSDSTQNDDLDIHGQAAETIDLAASEKDADYDRSKSSDKQLESIISSVLSDHEGLSQAKSIEVKLMSREAELYGDDYDSFREQIEGTTYTGGIDPDDYQKLIDDLEQNSGKITDLYMTPRITAA